MTPLLAMFIGFAIVWAGLFLYVLRLHRIGRALEAEVGALQGRRR
ncbi:MAG TPA: CcmD family protein [Dehalococcoidia bacterium]|nr:CcmD family protein [Dehalococcoidia bacterium]